MRLQPRRELPSVADRIGVDPPPGRALTTIGAALLLEAGDQRC
jgi:hypothetical protein